MDKDFFVQKVKLLCLQKGIKPTNACKESGVGGSFLSDINRGQVPSVAKVQMLAEYLGVTVSDLLGEKTPPADQAANGREAEFVQLFGRLTPEQQALVLAQLKGIVDAQDK